MRISLALFLPAAAAAVLLVPLNAGAAIINLTTAGSSSGFVVSSNGVTYRVDQIDPQSTGTGVIDPFVRIQAHGDEEGYNTSLGIPMDDKAPSDGFTRALALSEIPIVVLSDGFAYRQFILDINEDSGGPRTNPHELLSLNQIQIFLSTGDRIDGSSSGTPAEISFSQDPGDPTTTEIFQLSSSTSDGILLNYALNSGSGSGDMFLYIRDSAFDPTKGNFVIFYSQFGEPSGSASSSDGFEEWAVLKEDTPDEGPLLPEPTSIVAWLLGAGGLGFILRRRMSKAAA